MNEEILEQFRVALNAIVDRLDQMDEMYHNHSEEIDNRLHTLEHSLYTEILEPCKKLEDGRNKKHRKEEFSSKYKDTLDPLVDNYKKLYGDELDLYSDVFENYDTMSDEEKEDYIKQMVEHINNETKRMKDNFGEKPTEVEITEVSTEPLPETDEKKEEGEDKEPLSDEEDKEEDNGWDSIYKKLPKELKNRHN